MLEFLVRLLSVAGTMACLGAAITGVGLLVWRASGVRRLGMDDVFLAFWCGYGLVVLFLMIWNFVLPVRGAAEAVVLALGAAGLLASRAAVAEFARRFVQAPRGLLAIVAISVCFIADRAMAAFESYDGALYHLQGVRWAEAYPAVPGIANLHGPLAFNNANFLYDAMVDSGVWAGRGFHVANALLLVVALLQAVAAGWRARARRASSSADVFRLVLLAPVLYLVGLNSDITSYSADIPVTLLLLASMALAFDLFEPRERRDLARDAWYLVALAIVLSAAVHTKATAIVAGAVLLPVTAIGWRRVAAPPAAHVRRTFVRLAAIVLVFGAAWMARGIILSGYPVFPLSLASAPVDWRAPIEHARAEMAYVAYTEREFSWHIVGRGWVRHVLSGDPFGILVPSVVTIAAAWFWFRERSLDAAARIGIQTIAIVVPVLVAIVAWFATAPSTRYCPAFFWTLAALSVARAAGRSSLGPRPRRLLLAGVVGLGVSPIVVIPATGALAAGRNPIAAVVRSNVVEPGPDHGFHPVAHHVAVEPFTIASGMTVNVPVRDADTWRTPNACWDAPLPCTPNPDRHLRLRQPGNLARGFRVDGDWRMDEFPYYWDTTFLAEWRRRARAEP
jgi:hypothetical protein